MNPVNTRLLKAQMLAANVSVADLTAAQGWKCEATAYRKLSGQSAFTVPEVNVCVSLLGLDVPTAWAIFFARA